MKLNFQWNQWQAKSGVGFTADATGCQFAIASAPNGPTKLLTRPAPAPTGTGATAAPTPSQWLAQFRPELGKGPFRLATAIDSREVFCKHLSLPANDPAELQQMLSLQVEKLSPLPMEEVVWSYETLGSEGGNSDVLLVFGRKQGLVDRASAFGDEFPPDLIDVDLVVLWRALRARKAFEGKKHCGLLWLDTNSRIAKCMLLKGSTPLLVEHLPLDETKPAALPRALSSLLLGSEAITSVHELEEIFLFGPDQTAASIKPVLAEQFNCRVTPLQFAQDLSAATGLAQRALHNGQAKVNLLPLDFIERQQKKLFRQQATHVGIAVLAVYALILVLFVAVTSWRQFSIKRTNSKLTQLAPTYSKARVLQTEVDFLKQKLDDRRSALETWRVMNDCRPDQLFWLNFSYKQNQGVVIGGTAQNASDVYTFIDKLEKCGLFSQVKSGRINNAPNGGVTFPDITCTFKGVGSQSKGAP